MMHDDERSLVANGCNLLNGQLDKFAGGQNGCRILDVCCVCIGLYISWMPFYECFFFFQHKKNINVATVYKALREKLHDNV